MMGIPTNKEMEAMTIDELLEKFEELREHEYQKGNTEGAATYSHCRQLLETNRVALEAGMRGTLRMQICDESYIDSNDVSTPSHTGYIVNNEGASWAIHTVEATDDAKNKCEQFCKHFAYSLNLTAEFVEPTDDK